MKTKTEIDTALAAFLEEVQARVTADYVRFTQGTLRVAAAMTGVKIKPFKGSTPIITLVRGRRYAKLVSCQPDANAGASSAFGFVDLTNGDVLYAASWAGPAKNFPRGNIFDENKGAGRVKWTGVY